MNMLLVGVLLVELTESGRVFSNNVLAPPRLVPCSVTVHVVQYFLNLLRTIQSVNRLTVSSILSGCFINLKNTEPRERIPGS